MLEQLKNLPPMAVAILLILLGIFLIFMIKISLRPKPPRSSRSWRTAPDLSPAVTSLPHNPPSSPPFPTTTPPTTDHWQSLESKWTDLAEKALERNTKHLLAIMEERHKRHHQALEERYNISEKNLSARQNQVASLVTPIQNQLQNIHTQMSQLEATRQDAYLGLKTACESMQKQFMEVFSKTSKKGSWGEIHLRNIIEMAGLTEHVDFDLQPSFPGKEQHSRPDALIKLPQKKCIIVDSKAPLEHFLQARELECQDPEAFKKATTQHIKNLREHIRNLAKKPYLKDLSNYQGDYVSAEFIVMFVPLEGLYALALEHHVRLFEEASLHGIIISTPSSLLALMKTIAFIWQEHDITNHSREIISMSTSLMDSLTQLSEHLFGLGKNLEKSVSSYNGCVKAFKNDLMPKTASLSNLGVQKKGPRELPSIEKEPKTAEINPQNFQNDKAPF